MREGRARLLRSFVVPWKKKRFNRIPEGSAMDGVTVISHPLVQHKLTSMRKKETSTASFRRLLREISTLL